RVEHVLLGAGVGQQRVAEEADDAGKDPPRGGSVPGGHLGGRGRHMTQVRDEVAVLGAEGIAGECIHGEILSARGARTGTGMGAAPARRGPRVRLSRVTTAPPTTRTPPVAAAGAVEVTIPATMAANPEPTSTSAAHAVG